MSEKRLAAVVLVGGFALGVACTTLFFETRLPSMVRWKDYYDGRPVGSLYHAFQLRPGDCVELYHDSPTSDYEWGRCRATSSRDVIEARPLEAK